MALHKRTHILVSSFFALPLLIVGCDVSNDRGLGKEQEPDPVVVDFPIAFVARSLPLNDEGKFETQNILNPSAFHPGAKLIIKDRAKTSAAETIITAGLFADVYQDPDDDQSDLIPATYDVKDLEPAPDGKSFVFAMRAPEEPNADIQPTWNLWLYDLASKKLLPLMKPQVAEQGQDVSPHFLPDGRIVFSSTRQKRGKAILLDESKEQYSGLEEGLTREAFNLHVLNPSDGTIEQISFNPSHDLQPTVLNDGRIAFLRWDHISGKDQLSFYTIHPDGSHLERYYGYNSQNTGPNSSQATFWQARELPSGELLVNFRARASNNWGGDLVTINTAEFTDNTQPNPQNPGSGTAQQSIAPIAVDIQETPKPFTFGGLYNSAFPLNDGTSRLLTSWSPCRLLAQDENKIYPCASAFLGKANIVPANPSFGLWVLDLIEGTQLPLKPPTQTEIYTDAIVLAPQVIPSNISPNLDDQLMTEGLGLLHIRNVYDIDGNLPSSLNPMPHLAARSERPARFIRLVKSVPIPDDDILDFNRSAFGVSQEQLMRDILGYIPVEPDGSAKFKVPANVPFMLNLVDATGKRLPNARHNTWLSLQAGEIKECVGCHERNSNLPHGRTDAEISSGYIGAPFENASLQNADGSLAFGASTGQTMAENFADNHGPRIPSIDVLYRDLWTLPATEPDIALAYQSIAPNDSKILPPTSEFPCAESREPVVWQKPTQCQTSANPSPFAASTWGSLCRITINYPSHIQPLWDRDRRSCDKETGATLTDNTCTRCHSDKNFTTDGLMALPPAASLVLATEYPSVTIPTDPIPIECNTNLSQNYVASYTQLFSGRLQLELVDGKLTAETEIVKRNAVDANGNPIFNEDGSPLRVDTRVCKRSASTVNVSGAINQAKFFPLFEGNDVIHAGLLNPSELRLIAEWLDIGAQYYNNPFAAPLNN